MLRSEPAELMENISVRDLLGRNDIDSARHLMMTITVTTNIICNITTIKIIIIIIIAIISHVSSSNDTC